jgi:probable phosphoglycerate mutase
MMVGVMDLYLARHGETEWSLSGRHTSRTDLDLTPKGEARAAALRTALSGISFAASYSSPMRRALRTAELAGFPHPTLTDLLKEFDYGDYEGVTTAEILRTRPGWELFRDGCPGGESPAAVYERARKFVELACGAGEGATIAFAHGHILRAVAAAFLDLGIAAAARLALDTGSLSILRQGERGRVMELWNRAVR